MADKRVLAIFAHADDELGAAGTMANHADNGDQVTLVFLTKGENSTTVRGDMNQTIQKRKEHAKKIEDLLGVSIRFLDFIDSRIEYSMENGYILSDLIREIRPHIVITWNEYMSMGAGHPDHRNTAKLVWDAINYARYQNSDSEYPPHREPINLYRYFNPQSSNSGETQLIDVTHQEEKIRRFIEIYKEAYGDWPVEDFKFNSLKYYGAMGNVSLAEVFEVVVNHTRAGKLLD